MLTRSHDKLLERDTPGRFRRYPSLAAAGIDINEFSLSWSQDKVREDIRTWKEKFIRMLSPKFRVAGLVRGEVGSLLNTDEALEGIPECYRRTVNNRKAPIRIGINASRESSASNITAMRGGAILALVALAQQRGQQTEITLAYGNGFHGWNENIPYIPPSPKDALIPDYDTTQRDNIVAKASRCHVRIDLRNVNEDMLARVCCSVDTIEVIGKKLVHKLGRHWRGFYRFYQFPWEQQGNHEFDFVLDRIDSSDEQTEYNRIVRQLEAFKLI